MEAMDSKAGEPLCFIGVVIISLILPVLGIMAHNTSRKMKLVNKGLLFHSSAIALPLHCVLGHDMLLSQCLPPPTYTNDTCVYWVNLILGLTLQQTVIPFERCQWEGWARKTPYQLLMLQKLVW